MTGLYRVWAVAFVLVTALLAVPGNGQADRMKGGGHGGMMGGDMMSQLSPEEQKVVQDIMNRHHGDMVAMHKKIFAKRAELNAVMAQEKFDAGKASAMVNELAAMESDLIKKKMSAFIEMRQKGVSYYGTCMIGGRGGPCAMGGMGSGMSGRMMDGGMMGGDMQQPQQQQ